MREILFRGKQAEGKWVFGDIRHDYDGEPKCISDYCGSNPVDPVTVGQYTGLTDKNGKRIFEGDTVKVEYVGGNTGLSGTETVAFHDGMFGYFWGYNRDFTPLAGFVRHTFEVIGNIHDNPEKEKGQG